MTRASLVRAALAAGLVLAAWPCSLPAQVRPGGGGFGTSSNTPPSDDEFLMHVLRRTTFGPTTKSLAEIRAMGADAWLWRQLHPETIDDSALEARLALELPPADDLAYQWGELTYEFLQRSATSERQLEAVMTQFWENHFDTSIEHGNNDDQWHAWAKMEYDEDAAFRAHAFSPFRVLLEDSAKSAAMMWFLDNYQNTVRQTNENYARELLELHSLGVDCGYDQFDVEQVARIFSGWTGVYFARVPPDPCGPGELPPACDPNDYVEGGFLFDRGAHDLLPKPNPSDPDNPRSTVLGTTFPAGQGLEEGLRVLDIVSEHPCTAQFMSLKLIQHFVMDAPPREYVDRIATTWLETGGDVREVLWAIFQSPEFRDPANFGGKVRTPLEQTLATLRAVEGAFYIDATGYDGYEWPQLFWVVYNQGQWLFRFAIPTGYPEVGGPWISANGLLERWKSADALMFAAPRANAQIVTDPFAVAQRLRLTDADAVIDHYARLILGGKLDEERRPILRQLLVSPTTGRYEPADAGQTWRLRETVANMLGFPDANKQ